MVNRLAPEKNCAVLLHAAAYLKASHPEAYHVLVGSGPDRESLEQLAKSLGVSERVVFTGFVEDPAVLRREFTAFVAAGDEEAFCYSILEAMASGLPILAAQAGGNPELVEQGKNGLLFPPGSPSALAEAMQYCIENPATRETMAHEAQALAATRFSAANEIENTLRVYRGALKR
jgi:glycosyltransferase involved in cell wall biosynthesis